MNRFALRLTPRLGFTGRPLRGAAILIVTIASLSLTACGGGGVDATIGLDIGVQVDGVAVSVSPSSGGGASEIQMTLGQSVALDANEPVTWTLYVGGAAVSGTTTVVYGGVILTQSAVSDSQIVLQTSGTEPLAAPVEVELVAASQADAQQVATYSIIIN